jgi:hypothetical protein
VKRWIAQLLLAAALLSCARSALGEDPPRWTDQPTRGPSVRVVAAGEVAGQVETSRMLAGGSLTLAGERRFSIHPWLNEVFYGEAMGLELRGRIFRTSGPTPDRPREIWTQAGAAFTSSVLVDGSSAARRLRVPGLFPLLLPEIGATFRPGSRPVPTLRWSAPIAYLVQRNVALELTPSATLIAPTPREHPNLFVGLGVGLSFRQVREPYFAGGDVVVGWESGGPACGPQPTLDGRGWDRNLDLSAALPYRRYLAVTRVTPLAHYFRVARSSGGELLVRVLRRESGATDVAFEPGSLPNELFFEPPGAEPPPELAEAARAYLEKQCGRQHFAPIYAGTHRTVILEEFVVDPRLKRQGMVLGWHATHVVAMNETLDRVLSSVDESGARARIWIPEGSRFLPSSGAPAWKVDTPSEIPETLHAEIAEVARRFDRGLPTTPLAELVPPDRRGIPRELDPHLRLTVTLSVPMRGAPTSKNQAVELPLALHDAVFGPGATGDGTASFGFGRFRVHAALAPSTPRTPVAGLEHERYQGALTLVVDHEGGGHFEQWYPVDGELEVDGDGVTAPNGLRIVAPSRDAMPRLGKVAIGDGRGDADVAVHARLPQLESE